MQAILNGLTGSGLLLDENGGSVLHFEDGLLPFATREDELRNVLGEARHIDFLNVADASEAREILSREHLREESLDLALILLDPELSDETRTEAAALLNQMLLDWDLRSWLEGVLYGAPLPANADMEGALRNARGMNGNAVIAMLSRLSDLQPAIARVHEAWNSVCARCLSSADAQKEATVLVARNGVFRLAVHAYEGKSSDEFRFAALRVLQPMAEHRRIVEELTSELRLHQADRRAPRLRTEDDPSHTIRDEQVFDHSVSIEIQRRKDAIVGFMRAARLDLVGRYVNQLVDYQLPFDRRGEYTSKSLCDLAMEAKSLELFELQLELAQRAVSVRYEDGWAWAQVGDALLILNKFGEALSAYQHASEFNEDAIGRRGYALVLFRMGRAEESLAAYEDAIRDYPTDAVAQDGRAEVLKSMGQLDDALAAYDAVVREFPSHVVARTGRAEVLKSMGQLDDALAAYDAVVDDFPNNVVARNGRAKVLKSMGRLDEALAAYDAVVREFPASAFARAGRAEVLKSMGQLDDALAAYDAFVREFPNDVVARNGRAEVLKSMGQLDVALTAYRAIVQEFASNAVAKNGLAAVLCALGRYDEVLAVIPNDSPRTRQDWIAFHIRGMAMVRVGRIDEASTIFLRGSLENPFAADRDFFKRGLALTRICERAYGAALNILSNVRDIGPDPVLGLLRGHSAGALGDLGGAARFLSATGPRNDRERDVKAELERRFVRSEPPLHDDDWLRQREVDCVLLAA